MPAFCNSPSVRHSGYLGNHIPVIYQKDGRPVPIIAQQITASVESLHFEHIASGALRTDVNDHKDINSVDLTRLVKAEEQPALLSSRSDDAQLDQTTTSIDSDGGAPPVVPSHPAIVSSAAKSTRSHSRPKDPNHIRRPRNAFIVFRSWYMHTRLATGEGQQNELSKEAGQVWGGMSDEEKKKFRDQAAVEKKMHKEMYPDYVYAPSHRNGGGAGAKGKTSGTKKKITSSMSVAVRKKALLSSSGSSSTSTSSEAASSPDLEFTPLPLTPRPPRTPRAAAQRPARQIFEAPTSSSSSEPFSSEFEETPSPLLVPSFAGAGALAIVASPVVYSSAEEEENEFVPTENIPVLNLTLTSPVLVEDQKILEPSLIPPPVPFHAHLDADTAPLNHFGPGSGYGFNSYLLPTGMYDALPILPQTNEDSTIVKMGVNDWQHYTFASAPSAPMLVTTSTPALYLPHPDDGYMMDYTFVSSSSLASDSTSYMLGGVELDPELEPVTRSVSALNLDYEYMDCEMTNTHWLEKVEEAYFDFDCFDSPLDVKGEGKENAA